MLLKIFFFWLAITIPGLILAHAGYISGRWGESKHLYATKPPPEATPYISIITGDIMAYFFVSGLLALIAYFLLARSRKQ